MVAKAIRPFPAEMESPGFVAGGGLNRSLPRNALSPITQWTLNNVHPTPRGYGNIGIGTGKVNTNRLTTAPVRAIFKFGTKRLFVRDGNLYSIPTGGGSENLESSSAFDSTATVRWAIGRGSSGITKVFLCDGTNQPKVWDGTTLSNMTAFASNILTEIKTSQRPNKVLNYKNRILWSFSGSGVNSDYILASNLEDGETYTVGAGANNAWFEILDREGAEITAIATLKRSGQTKEDLAIVAYTEKQAFVGQSDDTPGTNRFGVFSNISKDIGAINQECVVNYLNDLYSMSPRGIGALSAVENEVQSTILEAGIQINPLIQSGAMNTAFEKSFLIHCKERNSIWLNLPSGSDIGNTNEGFVYPETPMNLTIGYTYAIMTATGEIVSSWYTRRGAGWGWACAEIDGRDVYLGSYFGDIYKAFDGDEYERNPLTASTRQPILSTFETGDLSLESSLTQYKEVLDLIVKWFVPVSLTSDFTAIWDGAERGLQSLNKVVSFGLGASLWDVALWDVALWTEERNVDVNVTPPDGGRSLRLKTSWYSEIDGVSNHGSVYALTGLISEGKRLLRFL
jgi:hypothetical protein